MVLQRFDINFDSVRFMGENTYLVEAPGYPCHLPNIRLARRLLRRRWYAMLQCHEIKQSYFSGVSTYPIPILLSFLGVGG